MFLSSIGLDAVAFRRHLRRAEGASEVEDGATVVGVNYVVRPAKLSAARVAIGVIERAPTLVDTP